MLQKSIDRCFNRYFNKKATSEIEFLVHSPSALPFDSQFSKLKSHPPSHSLQVAEFGTLQKFIVWMQSIDSHLNSVALSS